MPSARDPEKNLIRFHIDVANPDLIEGWAFSERSAVKVTIAIDGVEVASLVPSLPRSDVAMDYGHARSADISGFRYVIDKNILRSAGGTALDVLLTISEHSVNKPQSIQVPVSIRATEDYSYAGLDPKTHGPVLGPFPEYVLRWLLHVEREADYLFSPWSDSSM